MTTTPEDCHGDEVEKDHWLGPHADGKSKLFAPERQQAIVKLAREHGRVDVAHLSHTFAVTTETVRRDLNALEQMGVLRRVHGGAVSNERLDMVPDIAQRSTMMTAEKRAIARAAQAEIPLAGAVLIDAGTTTARLADIFPMDRELTVVTNALPVAEALVTKPKLTVYTLGGRLRPRTLASVEMWPLQVLTDTSVDVAFIATNGISIKKGLTTPDPSEATVKRAMIEAAQRVVILADHTKLYAEHFSVFASLGDVDLILTDDGASEDELQALREAGLEIRIAKSADSSSRRSSTDKDPTTDAATTRF